MARTDLEIDNAAREIFSELKEFYDPRDATSIMCLVLLMICKEAFAPTDKDDAIASVDKGYKMIKEILHEGWQ